MITIGLHPDTWRLHTQTFRHTLSSLLRIMLHTDLQVICLFPTQLHILRRDAQSPFSKNIASCTLWCSEFRNIILKQESILVRCVPPGGSAQPSPGCRPPPPPTMGGTPTCRPPGCKRPCMQTLLDTGPLMQTPSPVDRQTPVKTLPCPKLRLRAVTSI